jgi:hypothetical protein
MDASLLAGWENFYVITGSSAGGLTGITFVIIALIRDVQHLGPTPAGTASPPPACFCYSSAFAMPGTLPSG